MLKSAVALVLLALCASLSACGTSSSSPTTVASSPTTVTTSVSLSSPKRALASIVAAALAQRSVHWEENTDYPEHGGITITADVTADSGKEQASFYEADSKAEIRLVNSIVYVKGTSAALGSGDLLRLSPTQRVRYAGQWISIPKGDELYPYLAEGLTLRSVVQRNVPQDWLRFLRRTSHGRRILVVRGTVRSIGPSGNADLAIPARGEPLPMAFTVGFGGSGDYTWFRRWNEPVNVQPPADSTPISTVRRS